MNRCLSIVWDKYARRDGDTAPEKDFLVFPKYNQVKTNMQMCPRQSKLEAMVKFVAEPVVGGGLGGGGSDGNGDGGGERCVGCRSSSRFPELMRIHCEVK